MTTFFPYGQQSINQADIDEVTSVLKSSVITRGPVVKAFEESVANYTGARYGVAFTSGSTALLAAYSVLEVGPKDKFLVSPNTFIATSSFATERHARCVFIDIDRQTGNLDLENLKLNLEFHSTTGKLIIAPVHFAGIAIDMEKLKNLIKGSNVYIVEDAAHALGSRYPNLQKVGSCTYSDMTIFSFHPLKNITTGEGGMVMTNDDELYRRLLLFRNSGIERDPNYLEEPAAPWYYEVQKISNNYHLTEFQAALGLSQMKRLDEFSKKRKMLVKYYRKKLKGLAPIQLFNEAADELTCYHLMTIQINFKAVKKNRTEVMNELKRCGIGTQYHYIPLYRHPCYRKVMGELEEYYPEMELYYQQALTLPLYYDLSTENIDYIVENLKEVLKI